MKYQNYAEYKDSGVEWLDQVPVHWVITSLKMLIDVRDGTHDTPAYVEIDDSSFPLVTSKDVTSGVLSFELCKHISEEDYLSIIKRSKVDVGDIIMPMIGTVGSPIVVYERDDFAIKNLALFKTSKNQNINTSFLNYFLQSSECEIQFSLEARGGVQNFVSLGVLRDLGFPKIPNEEQTKIANFLDHETARIDTLIEKQQQLIKLLKEKRQAVISHAVTKGLNPNAPMRDSGVEWLGEVPEHWSVSSLGYYAQISTGATPDRSKSIYWGGDIPWIKTGEVRYDEILETEEYITEDAVANSSVKISPAGTLLMAMYGQGITRGRVAILGVAATYNQACAAITPNEKIWNQYLRYFFMAAYHAIRDGGNETSQMNLNADIVSKFKISIPDLDTQHQIADYLNTKLKGFDVLLTRAESAIELMNERRTALISAAVTGKIDVRNWQAPEPVHKPKEIHKEEAS